MFKKLTSLKKHHQLAYFLIMTAALISIWRGIWGLSDTYLFPSNPQLSFLISLIIGVVVMAMAHYKLS